MSARAVLYEGVFFQNLKFLFHRNRFALNFLAQAAKKTIAFKVISLTIMWVSLWHKNKYKSCTSHNSKNASFSSFFKVNFLKQYTDYFGNLFF